MFIQLHTHSQFRFDYNTNVQIYVSLDRQMGRNVDILKWKDEQIDS